MSLRAFFNKDFGFLHKIFSVFLGTFFVFSYAYSENYSSLMNMCGHGGLCSLRGIADSRYVTVVVKYGQLVPKLRKSASLMMYHGYGKAEYSLFSFVPTGDGETFYIRNALNIGAPGRWLNTLFVDFNVAEGEFYPVVIGYGDKVFPRSSVKWHFEGDSFSGTTLGCFYILSPSGVKLYMDDITKHGHYVASTHVNLSSRLFVVKTESWPGV